MSTTAQLKTQIQSVFPDSLAFTLDATWLTWVNILRRDIYKNITIKYDAIETVKTVATQIQYTYPTGVTIDDIASEIYIDGIMYKKINVRAKPGYNIPDGYYFWNQDSKLNIYPTPTVTDLDIEIPIKYVPADLVISDPIDIPEMLCDRWIRSQICIDLGEDQKSQKWIMLYNDEEQKLRDSFNSMAPMSPTEQIISTW